jgi:hypothetical protein
VPPVWLVAGAALVAGFGVAEATGVRALGGIVLAAGIAWCFARWNERLGTATAAGLAATVLAAFVAAHVAADTLGSWGAVFSAAALTAGAAYGAQRSLTPPARPRR